MGIVKPHLGPMAKNAVMLGNSGGVGMGSREQRPECQVSATH